jgi:uncharacterized protein (DUF427 family)
MAISMMKQMMSALPQLRYQPSHKRVRVRLGDIVVADTEHPMLIWEPRRIVPSYAIPEADITAGLVAVAAGPTPEFRAVEFGVGGPPLLDPGVPFAVHTADGEPLTVRTAADSAGGAAFRLADPDLSGYVVLDFGAFDWLEEDEPIVSHPRDPFHRIDVRRSSRKVRIEHQGTVLAETSRAHLLFEGAFPMVRYYLPREDVRVSLEPGTMHSACAYKGNATHYSVVIGDDELANIAWSYDNPLSDAVEVAGLICFYQERLDLIVDGTPVERVRTPWS